MSELAYVKVFLDWKEATKRLTHEEKGRLIDAMIQYARGEEFESIVTGHEVYLFPVFQLQIDRDKQEYIGFIQTQKNNGKKGGRPKNPKNPPLFSETQKSQDKEEEKDKDKENITPLPPLDGASPKLQEAFRAWVRYKQERRETYKPTGLKALETEVLNNAKMYGDNAVAELISFCMASNWKGIIFDRLKGTAKIDPPPPRKQYKTVQIDGEWVDVEVEE